MTARRRYIDWARGLAVLVMIEAHTVDAWTRAASRSSSAFGNLLLLGGFAAPAFLWLAGVGLALSAERVAGRVGTRRAAAEAVVRRGAEIFILAFLFRLQAFVISPGSPPVTLFRVDILNVMGPAIAASGVLWAISSGPAGAALSTGLASVGLAMVTPVIRQAEWVSGLPTWFQWYLRPFGDHTTFTLLPWAGFVFAGAACGSLLARVLGRRGEGRLMAALSLAGLGLVVLGLFTARRPSIYAVSDFWTSSPTYFAVRVGILMLALGVLFAFDRVGALKPRAAFDAVFGVLERFGRNSLFIYWIHVELVYGYTTWVIHRRLPLWGTATAYMVFCSVMFAAILLRDRIVDRWRASGTPKSASPSTAAAQA
jgi:uncharacterized membrane protein